MDELGQLPRPGRYERLCRSVAFVFSYLSQGVGLAVLVICALVQPRQFLQLHKLQIAELIDIPPSAPRPMQLDNVEAPQLPRSEAVVVLPANLTLRPVPPLPVEVHHPAAPETNPPPQMDFRNNLGPNTISVPGKVVPVVHTGGFSSEISDSPSPQKRKLGQVQSGGFGDPNGIQARGDGTSKRTIGALGRFDLPSGPGHGNGTGGAQAKSAVIPSTRFGDVQTASGQGMMVARAAGPTTGQSVFGDVRPEPLQRTHPKMAKAPQVTPVEVLSKPKPAYSDEARRLKLEGEVVLEVLFTASGQVQVVRVIQGLGHGLDGAAVSAAENIRYRPATHDGQPIDSTAVIHVTFQLAY